MPGWRDFLAVQSLTEQWSSGHGQGLEHSAFDPRQTLQQSCPKSTGNFVFLEVILELDGGLQGSERALNKIAVAGEM